MRYSQHPGAMQPTRDTAAADGGDSGDVARDLRIKVICLRCFIRFFSSVDEDD